MRNKKKNKREKKITLREKNNNKKYSTDTILRWKENLQNRKTQL